MRKNRIKKIVSITLAAVMTLGLCACGNVGGKKNENAGLAKENVYRLQEFELPDFGGDDYSFRGSSHRDGRVYMLIQVYHWSEDSDVNDLKVVSMKDDGTDIQVSNLEMPDWRAAMGLDTPEAGDGSNDEPSTESGSDTAASVEPGIQPRDNDTETQDEPEEESGSEESGSEESESGEDGAEDVIMEDGENDVWENSYYNNFSFGSDGQVYALRSYRHEDYTNEIYTQRDYVCSWKSDGSFQWERELEGLRSEEDEYIYVNSMTVGADGTVNLLLAGDSVYGMTIDTQGNVSERKAMPDDVAEIFQRYDRIILKDDGTMLLLYYDNDDWTKEYLATYDPATGVLGEASQMPSSFGWSGYNTIDAGMSSDLVCSNNSGIYIYNRGDAECTLKMSLVNSDVFVSNFSAVIELSDTSFLAVYYEDYNSGLKAGIFNYVDPKDVPDKSVLVLAGSYIGSDIKKRVIEFNRSSQEYRIVVKDYDSYNSYEDYQASYTQLNNDIVTGNMPDILITSGLPVENYVSKGLLADIGKMIEKDEELSQEEFLQNVFDAYRVNEKLYYVIPSFNVSTMIGKTSIVGDRTSWTMEDMLQLQATLPEDTSMIGELIRPSFISMMMQYCGSDFVDVSSGKCNFDSSNFISMLEFAKSLPEQRDEDYYGDDYWMKYESQYREDRTILCNLYLGNFRNCNYTINGYFGEPVSFIGFPTESGQGSYIEARGSYAISARSNFTDGAWEFVRYYLTEEYQSELDWGLPVLRKCFDEKAQEALERPYYLDENGEKVEYDDYFYMNGEEILLEPMSQEQVDQLVNFVLSVDKCYYSNDAIVNIINEEVEAYFSGQKPVEEVVKVIQSRAQLYVDENR